MRRPLKRLVEDERMTFDYLLGGIAVAVMLVYLLYALIKPEKF